MNGAFHRLLFAIALAKSQSIFFTTGYANATAYPKKNVAKSGGRFDLSLLKKEEGQNEHFAEKQPDAHSR